MTTEELAVTHTAAAGLSDPVQLALGPPNAKVKWKVGRARILPGPPRAKFVTGQLFHFNALLACLCAHRAVEALPSHQTRKAGQACLYL